MIGARRRRAAEAGLVRGCCLGIALLLVLVVGGVVLTTRAVAAPDLGQPPGGVAHGSTELLLAASLAADAAGQLLHGEHAVVVVSERDLTMIAQRRNPSPDRFRDPQVRIRNGHIVVSGDTSVGPLGVTAVVEYTLTLDSSSGATALTAQAVGYHAGQLPVPAVLGDRLNPHSTEVIDLRSLFGGNPLFATLGQTLDCLSVQPDGVHVGFHRPLTVPSTPSCS